MYFLTLYNISHLVRGFLLLRNSPGMSIKMNFPIKQSISNMIIYQIIVIKLEVYLGRN